jgi:hypothetical protein
MRGRRLGFHHEPEANRQLQPLCFWNRSTNPTRAARSEVVCNQSLQRGE